MQYNTIEEHVSPIVCGSIPLIVVQEEHVRSCTAVWFMQVNILLCIDCLVN